DLWGARGPRGLVWGQAGELDLLAYGAQRGFERRHLDLAGAHVAEAALRVVALDVHHHAVGELQTIAVEGGGERLLLEDAPADHRVALGVLALPRRHAAVEHRDLPVAPGARPLAADHELPG